MAGRARVRLPRDWATCEYGSHWPVLLAVLRLFPIRRVLETGSGLYSTNLILREPRVERLLSIENNPKWTRESDYRYTMALVEGAIADHLPKLTDFDLVFIDDDPIEERAGTIEAVLEQPHPLVVVHDADYPEYSRALAPHAPFVYTERQPWTALIWPR